MSEQALQGMDVITAILEIDRQAADRIKEANQRKDQILKDTGEETEKILSDCSRKAEQKLSELEKAEEISAASRKEALAKQEQAEIKRLDDIYEKEHAGWESAMFKAILEQ